MPFTVSHAAAVLPLHRWSKTRLPLAALMIGSMAPDFAYFLPGDPGRVAAHSVAGLFWYCLPTSLLLWLFFVRVLEQPTVALLPASWRPKFASSDHELTLRNLAWLSIAIIVGGLTHIVWDSFTHRATAATHLLPFLRTVVFEADGFRVRLFVILQHVSTILGLVVLAVWAHRLPHRTSRSARWTVSDRARIAAIVFMAAATLGFAFVNYSLYADIYFMRRLFHFATGGMAGGVLAWTLVATLIRWRAPRVSTSSVTPAGR